VKLRGSCLISEVRGRRS